MTNKYHIGVDLAQKMKWWQRLAVWLGFRNRWSDKSCMVVFKESEDGVLEIVNYKEI